MEDIKGIPHSQQFLTVKDLTNILPYNRSTVNKQVNKGVWGTPIKPKFGSKLVSKNDFLKKIKEYQNEARRN